MSYNRIPQKEIETLIDTILEQWYAQTRIGLDKNSLEISFIRPREDTKHCVKLRYREQGQADLFELRTYVVDFTDKTTFDKFRNEENQEIVEDNEVYVSLAYLSKNTFIALSKVIWSEEQEEAGEIGFVETEVEFDWVIGEHSVEVYRRLGSLGAATVNVVVDGGTAVNGKEFILQTTTLSWDDGDSSPKTVFFDVFDIIDERQPDDVQCDVAELNTLNLAKGTWEHNLFNWTPYQWCEQLTIEPGNTGLDVVYNGTEVNKLLYLKATGFVVGNLIRVIRNGNVLGSYNLVHNDEAIVIRMGFDTDWVVEIFNPLTDPPCVIIPPNDGTCALLEEGVSVSRIPESWLDQDPDFDIYTVSCRLPWSSNTPLIEFGERQEVLSALSLNPDFSGIHVDSNSVFQLYGNQGVVFVLDDFPDLTSCLQIIIYGEFSNRWFFAADQGTPLTKSLIVFDSAPFGGTTNQPTAPYGVIIRLQLDINKNITATGTVLNQIPISLLEFTAPTQSTIPENGVVNLTVRRTGFLNSSATIRYETENGTAIAGENYLAKTGTLSWDISDNNPKTISVQISDSLGGGLDGLDFKVKLSEPSGKFTKIGNNKDSIVTILDDRVYLSSMNIETLNSFYSQVTNINSTAVEVLTAFNETSIKQNSLSVEVLTTYNP